MVWFGKGQEIHATTLTKTTCKNFIANYDHLGFQNIKPCEWGLHLYGTSKQAFHSCRNKVLSWVKMSFVQRFLERGTMWMHLGERRGRTRWPAINQDLGFAPAHCTNHYLSARGHNGFSEQCILNDCTTVWMNIAYCRALLQIWVLCIGSLPRT